MRTTFQLKESAIYSKKSFIYTLVGATLIFVLPFFNYIYSNTIINQQIKIFNKKAASEYLMITRLNGTVFDFSFVIVAVFLVLVAFILRKGVNNEKN